MTKGCSRVRAVIAALSLGLALPHAAWAQAEAATTQASDHPVVTLAPVARTEVQARVALTGTLVAQEPVQIYANVAGYQLRDIRAEVGDRVQAGDVLAVLDDAALSAQMAQSDAEYARATASVSQSESQITSAEASLTQAAAALTRTASLRQSGSASQSALDQAIETEAAASAAAASARDGRAVARAALAEADAARRIARLNLGYAQITAPVDGVVAARTAERGAITGTGGEPLFTLIARGEIELAADVIETALGALKPGDAADVMVAGVGAVRGRVRLVPASVDPVTRLGQTRIALDPAAGLLIGLFASGWIVTDTRAALTVPLAAVLADDAGTRVQVVREGIVGTRAVRAGLVWQDRREIIDGLTVGEMVIARAGAFFRDGDQVRAAAP